MKKSIFVLVPLIFILFVSSCNSFNTEKYTPNPSDYIEWDGNYFYFDNYRYTSDLKDGGPFITELTYNEKTYAIDKVNHSVFKDDKLHMTFCVNVESDTSTSQPNRWTAYAIYSLENKETEYLYIGTSPYEIDLNKILSVSDNYAIISGTGKKLTKIDITSNEIETVYCDSYEVDDNYAVISHKNELLYSTLNDFEFKKIPDLSDIGSSFHYYIHTVNKKPFLQIIGSSSTLVEGQNIETNSLTYYDFASGKFYEVIKIEDNKSLSLDSNATDIFILSEPTLVKYNPYSPDDKFVEYKLFKENNVLYTVEFNEKDGIKLKELYSFKSEHNNRYYAINKIIDNVIYLNRKYFNKPSTHMYYNRIDSTVVYFDLENLSFIDEEDLDVKTIIAEYGNAVYYIKTKQQPVYMSEPNIHYYLYRFDKATKKEGLLNYFMNNEFLFHSYVRDGKQIAQIAVKNS